MKHRILVSLSLIVLFAGGVNADIILSPTSVLQNTAGEMVGYPIVRTIDQSGLQANFVSGVTDFDVYFGNPLHRMEADIGEWWAPVGPSTGTIDYDLGADYDLTRIALWNEDAYGFASFEVTVETSVKLLTLPIDVSTVVVLTLLQFGSVIGKASAVTCTWSVA